jgi:WD40 repeat protein
MSLIWTQKLSRRRFAQRSMYAGITSFCIPSTEAQRTKDEAKGSIHLARQFKNAIFLAASPDGEKLCLGFSSPGSEWPLWRVDVIETGSWRTIYSAKLQGLDMYASFFTSSQALCIDTTVPKSTTLIIDLRTGRLEKQTPASLNNWALDDGILLGEDRDGSLIRFNVPGYKELFRVPGPGLEPLSIVVSDDRQRFIRGLGREDYSVVCYRSADLERLWVHRIDIPGARWEALHNFKGSIKTAISADGRVVAVAAVDTAEWAAQQRFFVAVLNGEDGEEMNRLPINGDQGLAISPNGKLLAIGRRIPTGQDIDLLVEVYDIASGRLVATATHYRVPPGRFQQASALFTVGRGITFTPDGRYLVTSANGEWVRIWQLG